MSRIEIHSKDGRKHEFAIPFPSPRLGAAVKPIHLVFKTRSLNENVVNSSSIVGSYLHINRGGAIEELYVVEEFSYDEEAKEVSMLLKQHECNNFTQLKTRYFK
jgi:hypothetical protein